ncbi:hypothetical protein DMI62_06810 [Escherichia coli]|nr:hypothetical protein [Escherichia coli]
MLTSRVNNWRKLPPTGVRSGALRRDVPQRILVLGASGYIGQHLVHTLSQQGASDPGGGTSRRQTLQNCNWLMSVAIKSISTGRIIFRPCCRILLILSIFWCCTAWAKAVILSLRSAVALNVRDALREVPVKQVIFLSSLQAPPHEQSDHLRARQATADILRSGCPGDRTTCRNYRWRGFSGIRSHARYGLQPASINATTLGTFTHHAHRAGKPAALSCGAVRSSGLRTSHLRSRWARSAQLSATV